MKNSGDVDLHCLTNEMTILEHIELLVIREDLHTKAIFNMVETLSVNILKQTDLID